MTKTDAHQFVIIKEAAMIRALILGLTVCCLAPAAEQPPRQYDPKQPADALEIVVSVSGQVPLKLNESQALMQSLQTLAALVRADQEAKAKAAEPKPVEPAKPKD